MGLQMSEKEKVEWVRAMVVERVEGAAESELGVLGEEFISRALRIAEPRIGYLGELFGGDFGFLWSLPKEAASLVVELQGADWAARMAARSLWVVEREVEVDATVTALREMASQEKVKVSTYFRFLRIAFTATKDGPPIKELLETLGRESAILRLRHLIAQLKTLG